MPKKPTTKRQGGRKLDDLRARLDEAEETLRAIRSGEVDALVVSGVGGEQIYTLKGADHSYRVLIEDMNEGALTMTLDGVVLYSNLRFAEMIKTPLERVIGSMISTWIAPDSQDILQVLLQDGAETRSHGEITLLAGDGALVPGHLSTNVLQKEEAQKLFCLVVTDLSESKRTEALAASEKLTQQSLAASSQSRRVLLSVIEDQKRAEEEISKLNADLEQRVQQRTTQLEASYKELESFAYSVSHDLRVPLRAIDGFSKIAIEDYGDKLDDEGRRMLKVVRDNTSKMSKLIDDLLAYSRIGRQEAAKGTVNMAALARSVVDEIAQANPGRTVSVTIGKLPPAAGDPAMLRQALINLVSNSFKFTRPKPDAEIEIGFTTTDGEPWYFVKDNGAGFDMQYANKLFGVFQRLHSQEEFEGTGVGLAIVQRVIQKHGGKIRGESEVGKGAAFYFTLPG